MYTVTTQLTKKYKKDRNQTLMTSAELPLTVISNAFVYTEETNPSRWKSSFKNMRFESFGKKNFS